MIMLMTCYKNARNKKGIASFSLCFEFINAVQLKQNRTLICANTSIHTIKSEIEIKSEKVWRYAYMWIWCKYAWVLMMIKASVRFFHSKVVNVSIKKLMHPLTTLIYAISIELWSSNRCHYHFHHVLWIPWHPQLLALHIWYVCVCVGHVIKISMSIVYRQLIELLHCYRWSGRWWLKI